MRQKSLFVFLAVAVSLAVVGCGRSAKIVSYNHTSVSVNATLDGEHDDDYFVMGSGGSHTSKFEWGFFDGKQESVSLTAEAWGYYPTYNHVDLSDDDTFEWHLYEGYSADGTGPTRKLIISKVE